MVKSNPTHKEIIKKHLLQKKSINHYNAFLKFGIARLSVIIEELISEGMDIKYTRETQHNKFGETKQLLNYWI